MDIHLLYLNIPIILESIGLFRSFYFLFTIFFYVVSKLSSTETFYPLKMTEDTWEDV